MKLTPAQLEELKARNSCEQWARRWVRLRKFGQKFIGPCPLHSPDPTAADSTSFECDAAGWVCAVCADGGDVIKLVMRKEGVDFNRAIARLGGATPAAQDPEAARRAEEELARKQAAREREAAIYRARERGRARDLASYGKPLPGTPGEIYLRQCRGVDFPPEVRLRCDLKARFYVPDHPRPRLIHTGPALLAIAQRQDHGRPTFHGLHSTFIDLAQPKGKARLVDPLHPEAGPLNPKKMRGSKQGGHYELIAAPGALSTIVIGEGLEKVLAVWTAFALLERRLDGIAWWMSGDLGNLGGRAAGTVAHPVLKTASGRALRVPDAAPAADPKHPAIEIPDNVSRVVILGDSTSDRFTTALVVARAAARWGLAHHDLQITVAWSPDGQDFDDLLRAAGPDPAARAAAAAAILAIVDAAAPPVLPQAAAFAVPASAAAPKHPDSRTGGSGETSSGGRKGAPPAPAPQDDDPHHLNLRLAHLPQTDLANAERFRERWRDRLLFCPALPGRGDAGGWLYWDGKRWSSVGADEEVRRCEHLTVRGLQLEAAACVEEARRLGAAAPAEFAAAMDLLRAAVKAEKAKALKANLGAVQILLASGKRPRGKARRKARIDGEAVAEAIYRLAYLAAQLRGFGRASEANSKMVPIAKHAAPYLAIEPGQLDADRFAFNVNNGTLVFRREWNVADPALKGCDGWRRHGDFIRFKPHDPRDLVTKISPVDFDPAAQCPRWAAFLAEVQPEQPMRAFLQCWGGYRMTGDTGEARAALFHGGGRNGKGVFETATGYVYGDYGGSTPIETFTIEARTRSAGQATPELAKLPGIRALRASEPKRGARLDESLIKQVTGGDPLDARHLNRPFFTFLPQFKLTISTNHKPKPGLDEAIWARLTLVPFDVFIAEDKRDMKLGDKLQAEAPGILNWMLDGLSAWFEKGLVLPEKVRAATAEWRRANDQLQRFLDACCQKPPAGQPVDEKEWRARSSELLAVHNAWARAGGGAEWRQKGFTDAMEDRGFKRMKSSDMFFLGLKLVKGVSDFESIDGRPRAPDGAPPEPIDADDDVFPR